MKSLLLIFVILISANICYADDCMYDQEAQVELLESIAKSHPGGVIDLRERTITWSSSLARANSIQYGGCEHLVFIITKNIPKSKKLGEAEIFSLANELAKEYWESDDANALSNSIKDKTITRRSMYGSSYFDIPTEYYYSFYTEYNPLKGYVSIMWARNF